jgi:hypothetical protein
MGFIYHGCNDGAGGYTALELRLWEFCERETVVPQTLRPFVSLS